MAIYHDFYTINLDKINMDLDETSLYNEIEKKARKSNLKRSETSHVHIASNIYDLILEFNAFNEIEIKTHNYFFGNLFWYGWKNSGIKIEYHYYKLNEFYDVLKKEFIPKILEVEEQINFDKIKKLIEHIDSEDFEMTYPEFYERVQDWLRVYNVALSRNEDLILSIG